MKSALVCLTFLVLCSFSAYALMCMTTSNHERCFIRECPGSKTGCTYVYWNKEFGMIGLCYNGTQNTHDTSCNTGDACNKCFAQNKHKSCLYVPVHNYFDTQWKIRTCFVGNSTSGFSSQVCPSNQIKRCIAYSDQKGIWHGRCDNYGCDHWYNKTNAKNCRECHNIDDCNKDFLPGGDDFCEKPDIVRIDSVSCASQWLPTGKSPHSLKVIKGCPKKAGTHNKTTIGQSKAKSTTESTSIMMAESSTTTETPTTTTESPTTTMESPTTTMESSTSTVENEILTMPPKVEEEISIIPFEDEISTMPPTFHVESPETIERQTEPNDRPEPKNHPESNDQPLKEDTSEKEKEEQWKSNKVFSGLLTIAMFCLIMGTICTCALYPLQELF